MFRRACSSPWWLVLFDNSRACCYFCQRRQVGVLQVLRRLQGQRLANPLLIYHQPISTERHMLGKSRRRPPRRIGPRAFCNMRAHEGSSYLQAALQHGRRLDPTYFGLLDITASVKPISDPRRVQTATML